MKESKLSLLFVPQDEGGGMGINIPEQSEFPQQQVMLQFRGV